MKIFTYDEAKNFYDSFGKKQDKQFYEETAIDALIEQGEFTDAKNIVEFGCGTGKLASRLLENVSPDNCRYSGIDISQTMISLCHENIKPFSDRAKLDTPDQSADRFLSAYVLDLLSENDVAILLNEAYRILMPDGYLCLASLTHGVTLTSRFVELLWNGLYKLKPSIVGGCRPIDLTTHLPGDKWHIAHDSTMVSYGVPSQVVIAKKL
jgi:ubiquinone/menaquinone biosynthesis C-methylase UbiE